jgi:hypothetical protein
MPLKSNEKYLRFDEKSNTYDSLEKMNFFLDQVHNDLNYWKWSVIALHSSLYGAVILALQGTNPTRVINLKDKRLLKKLAKDYGIQEIDVNDTHQIGKIWDHGKLISFREAFDRITKKEYMVESRNFQSKMFKPEQRHNTAIEWINDELRNPFLHFLPKDWSIEIRGLKDIFKDCLEIIEFCLFKSGNVLLGEGKRSFEDILVKIKNHNELKNTL